MSVHGYVNKGKTMNTKQIAEEACEWIRREFGFPIPPDDSQIDAIIQSAIEKATEEVRKERDAWERVANWDESRAAHASEPIIPDEIIDAANKVAHWAKINGWQSGWCIGPVCDRTAHASEEKK